MELHVAMSDRLIRRYGRALTLLAHNWFVSTSAMVMAKDTWTDLGGFRDLRFCHDLDFALRVLARGRAVAYLEAPSWLYRCHGNNTASSIQDDTRSTELGEVLAMARSATGIVVPEDLRKAGYGHLHRGVAAA
jgi:hypothetical protein